MDEQRSITDKGGTMRLGTYECVIPGQPMLQDLRQVGISERHRHRYEFNSKYREMLEEKGLKAGGLSPDGKLVELVSTRIIRGSWDASFIPEFKSRPMDPHPLFASYIKACVEYSKRNREKGDVRRLAVGGRPRAETDPRDADETFP